MKSEYGVDTILEPLAGYNTARWAEGGWEAIDEATVRAQKYCCSVAVFDNPFGGTLQRSGAYVYSVVHDEVELLSTFALPHPCISRILFCRALQHLHWFVLQQAGKLFGIFTAQDRFGRPVLLFRNEWKLANVQGDVPQLELVPWSRPPDIESK